MFVCLFVRPFVCPSVCLSVCLFVCLFVRLFVCFCLFVCLFVCLSICLFVCLFVKLGHQTSYNPLLTRCGLNQVLTSLSLPRPKRPPSSSRVAATGGTRGRLATTKTTTTTTTATTTVGGGGRSRGRGKAYPKPVFPPSTYEVSRFKTRLTFDLLLLPGTTCSQAR